MKMQLIASQPNGVPDIHKVDRVSRLLLMELSLSAADHPDKDHGLKLTFCHCKGTWQTDMQLISKVNSTLMVRKVRNYS